MVGTVVRIVGRYRSITSKQLFRSRTLGKKCRCAANCKRKQQICAGCITKEEFGHGHRQIVFIYADRSFGKDLGVEWQIVLQVDGAFRMARRTGSE